MRVFVTAALVLFCLFSTPWSAFCQTDTHNKDGETVKKEPAKTVESVILDRIHGQDIALSETMKMIRGVLTIQDEILKGPGSIEKRRLQTAIKGMKEQLDRMIEGLEMRYRQEESHSRGTR